MFFFFNDTATTEIYTLSLHDALPISAQHPVDGPPEDDGCDAAVPVGRHLEDGEHAVGRLGGGHREGVHRGVEAGPEGGGGVTRRGQADAAIGRASGRERVETSVAAVSL